MPFTTKHNKRIKVQGSLETLRHFIPPPLHTHTHERSIVLDDSKLEKKRGEEVSRNERKGMRKAHNLLN